MVTSAVAPMRVQMKLIPLAYAWPAGVTEGNFPVEIVPFALPLIGTPPVQISLYFAAAAVNGVLPGRTTYLVPPVVVPVIKPLMVPLQLTAGPLLVGHTGRSTLQLKTAAPVALAPAGPGSAR